MTVRVMMSVLGGAGAMFAIAAFSASGQSADVDAGKDVFEQYCISCHDGGPSNATAPSLKGIAGRKVGSTKFPAYSDALKGANRRNEKWTDVRLDQYLNNPAVVYPGTNMAVRIQSPKNRANLVAYLKTLK